MFRSFVCTTSRRSAVVAGTILKCCWLTAHHSHLVWPTSPNLHHHNSSTVRLALLTSRRTAATASNAGEEGDTAAGAATLTDAEIIAAADWKSLQYEERLGFRGGDAITEARLRRHYYVLAKHFHPDTAAGASESASLDGTTAANGVEAFQNVKEAYDAISSTLKEGGGGWSSGSGNGSGNQSGERYARDFAGGFTYSDEARRRYQMRLLGETVMLFVAMTVLLIYVVGCHNKSRMKSRYLWHLVWIFFMIQLFPRLLAAAIIFAAHSMYLLENATLKEQAAIALIVDRSKASCSVKLSGIRTESVPHVVVQVTTSTSTAAKEGEKEEVSSTLTFDKGVTEFLLPVPTSPHAAYHIKAVDEERKLVLVDRTISALA